MSIFSAFDFADLLWLAGAFLIFSIAFYWVHTQYSAYFEAVAAGRIASVEYDKAKMGLFRFLVPIVRKSPLYEIASKIKWFEKQKKKYDREILAAGVAGKMDGNDIYAIRIFLCVIIPCFFISLSLSKGQQTSIHLYVMSVLSWFAPSILLSGLRKRRQKDIQLALPTVIDLLTLSTEAGLDFMGGLQKVVDKSKPSPLIEELTQVMKEIKLGASRAEALRSMSFRVDMTEITSFVAILVTADQMGGSIGKVLRAQSDAVRTARFVRAEKAGAAASQKMLFPLIFIILPAVFLMIFGPVIVNFFYGSGY